MVHYQNKEEKLQNRFIRYAKIDTQSDASSLTCPSTLKQKNLAHVLVAELLEMGIEDAHCDEPFDRRNRPSALH